MIRLPIPPAAPWRTLLGFIACIVQLVRHVRGDNTPDLGPFAAFINSLEDAEP